MDIEGGEEGVRGRKGRDGGEATGHTLVPSQNEVTMYGFCLVARANSACVSGLRRMLWKPLMLPQRMGRRPIACTHRNRFMITPGWSPSELLKMTPASSAFF